MAARGAHRGAPSRRRPTCAWPCHRRPDDSRQAHWRLPAWACRIWAWALACARHIIQHILRTRTAGGLVRDHQRELYRQPRLWPPCIGAGGGAGADRHARRVAVDRQQRSARHALPGQAAPAGRRGAAGLDLRPPVLDRRRLASTATTCCRCRWTKPAFAMWPRACTQVQDFLERPLGPGKPQHLCRVRQFQHAGMGILGPAGRRYRLRPAAGRK